MGIVYANRIFNEYLKENGLYHQSFAFEYSEEQRLIKDSMEDAAVLTKEEFSNLSDEQRNVRSMKYKHRLLRKKVQVMK